MWILIIIVIAVIYLIVMDLMVNNKLKDNLQNMENELEKQKFVVSKEIKTRNYEFKIDSINKKVAICIIQDRKLYVLKYNEIIDCEIIEDSNVIMKGGVGRALVGGALAGGIGAVVGANTRSSKNTVNNLAVRIITNNVTNSLYMITLINFDTEKNDFYKKQMKIANDIYSSCISIINNNKERDNSNNEVINDLEKINELKERGILTEEEFEKTKQKILGK